MKLPIVVVCCVCTAALAVGAAPPASANRMLEKYNVGGYVAVPGAKSYALGADRDPAVLPRATGTTRNSAQVQRTIAAASAYIKRFRATTALMLIDGGTVIFEQYQGLGGPKRQFFSMSIAKSLTSLAVGKAMCGGKIESLETRAGTIVPELNANHLGASTIAQLLMMSSGAYRPKFGGQPNYVGGVGHNPLTGRPYRGSFWPLRRGQLMISDTLWGPAWARVRGKNPDLPGRYFYYKSGDTMALAVVVQRATGMTLARYFEKSVWRHIGSSGEARWELDHEGTTAAASGFQARLADWARLALWVVRRERQARLLR